MKNSNNGMYLETLIKLSADFYYNKGILAIFKREIPIKIVQKMSDNLIKGKLMLKSTSDYYGVYEGKMFDFEAKQTMHEDFMMQNLKEHQLRHLEEIQQFGVYSFLLIHFLKQDEYFCIEAKKIREFVGKTKMPYSWIKENSFQLELIFPGILNFEKYLNFVYKTKS